MPLQTINTVEWKETLESKRKNINLWAIKGVNRKMMILQE